MLTVSTEGVAISRVPLPLLTETKEKLRRAFPIEQDDQWVLDLAQAHGWEEANRKYLAWHRDRGAQEMGSLMGAMAIARPPSPRIAAELVALAYEVFMLPEGFAGSIDRLSDDCIRISVERCPVFERIEQRHWKGITACSSFHHRQGWYDAIGLDAEDTIVAEEKWGDAGCVSEITFLPPASYD
jgi:hypothetical protein